MARIRLTPKFLRGERDKAYSDWKSAFWREMFQNSIDAGATEILISIAEGSRGTAIKFSDNGRGMTRDVVENVFFKLGESFKDDATAVGGFGRARLLTCFAMDSYSFRTGTLLCEGNCDEYLITETDEKQRGCVFDICIGDAATVEWMIEKLRMFLSRCQMNCKVFINDEKWSNWLHKRNLVREASFGNIHHNKSGWSGSRIAIRVKGVWMFDIPTDAPGKIVVEVNPLKSRDILLINRDGFGHGYEQELSSWVQQLAIDKKSALRSHRRKTKLIRGLGPRRSFASKQDEQLVEAKVPEACSPIPESLSVYVSVDVQEIIREVVEGDTFVSDLGSIYINDEFPDEHPLRRKINEYDPTRWEVCRAHGKLYRKGGNRKKLLIAWSVACEEAIRCLIDVQRMDEVHWLVGWDFSDDTGACHVSLSIGHALCLNPIDSDGRMRFRLGSKQDLKRLTALAKHEVAHISAKYHDETYANLLTDIDERYDEAVTFRAIKLAIAAA